MGWPADLDPVALRQPDQRSCGAATVLAARALTTGWRPAPNADEAAAEILTEHRLLTSTRSPRDRWQPPWPRALGTPPWAVVNALRTLTGRHLATVLARPRPEIAYQVLREQVHDRPVAVYLGSRWLPRHVVLAVDSTADGVRVFDPARGALPEIGADRWTHHRVGVAGWDYVWFVI